YKAKLPIKATFSKLNSIFYFADGFFCINGNVLCMSRCVSHERTIKSTKLRWKIPKNFPDWHRPSDGLYTLL
ncbi:hypothetical protein, partial [Gelidibacter algens]|uniref:hypothetical protein n=1 Tax=Gelidibacter algens TaxID=49280 RepID=UPI001B865F9C